MRTRPYSDFLWNIAGLIGVPSTRISTEIADSLNSLFNGNLRRIWDVTNWTDICPKGEARFCGNLLSYPNDLSNAAWVTTGLTETANSIANPADNRVTATQILETAANSAHKEVQACTFFPNQQYQVSAYARPSGDNYLYLAVNDGASNYSCFFNVYTGQVGTASGTTSVNIQQVANGFFLCTLTFTASASAGVGGVTVQCSADGSTLSYAGNTSNGLYVWGVLALQQSAISPAQYSIPWQQAGENEIETIFTAWKDNPYNASYPRAQGFVINDIGVQMISSLGWDTGTYGYSGSQGNPANPSYIYYRKAYKYFTGSTFDATLTYNATQQVYFTTTATTSANGTGDYYYALATTTATESPDSAPSKWTKIQLPEIFFDYLVWRTYGDWLVQDGQADKAMGAYSIADNKKDDELDRQERQQYDVFPMAVNTHVTSQSRY